MITIGNKQLCEYCLNEGSGKTCRFCGFDKAKYENEWGTLSPGSVLSGKYIVGKIIGKGGFGITYLAYDIKHEKKVALKEYYPVTYAIRSKDGVTVAASRAEDADTYKNGMEKFYEEASLVSRFNGNPNIVSVYEFFYENGTAYFVMELLRGISLKAYLDEHGALSPEETLYIADKVSSALVVTHSMNTLHRDISPDNIMLCEDGNVKLIDFGAARQVAADNPKSMSVILKQGFAPLEQYQRRGKQGPWTDLYSLGATLYYAATKQLLDDPMSRLDDDEEFQSNSHGIEPQLWEVIKHSLNINVEERYKDTVEFRAALNKVEYEPKPLVITLPEEQITAAAAAPIAPITAAAANGVTVSGGAAQVVMPGEKKPLNKKLIAILSSAIGVVLVAGITVIAVTLGSKKNSLGVKPGGNDSYQQSSGTISETGGEQNNSDAEASSTTTTTTTSSSSSKSSTSTSSSSSAVTSTSTPASSSTTTSSSTTSSSSSKSSSSTKSSSSSKSSSSTKSSTSTKTTTTTSSSAPKPEQQYITIAGKQVKLDEHYLDLSGVKLTDSDLKAISTLKGLKNLNIINTGVSDLSVLSSLTNLETILLSDNNVSDISFVSGMKNLSTFFVRDNKISDISPLKNCTKLSSVLLSGNMINDLSPLHNCKNIKDLTVTRNTVSDVKTFEASIYGLHVASGGATVYIKSIEGFAFPSYQAAKACKEQICKNSGISTSASDLFFSTDYIDSFGVTDGFF